jgi:acetyl esterase
MPDGWRLTPGVATARMVAMDPDPVRTVAMDPELEAFIPLFPPADLTDPARSRKDLAALAAAVPAPDTTAIEVQDRTAFHGSQAILSAEVSQRQVAELTAALRRALAD